MTKMKNSLVLGSILAATVMSSTAVAGSPLTGNVGIMSDYFFRGVDQEASATANGGLDYDLGNGLTLGAWVADMNAGIEADLYGAFSGEINQFSYSVGFTTYQYSSDVFDNATEINLHVGTGPISLEYSIGSIDSSPSSDYTFLALTFEKDGAYATYGTFGSDADGSFIEIGYGMEVSGIGLGIAIIGADEDLSVIDEDGDNLTDSEVSMVMSLSKSFDL